MSFRSKVKGLFDARKKKKPSGTTVQQEPLSRRVILFLAKNVEAHNELIKLLIPGCLLFVAGLEKDVKDGLDVHDEHLKHPVMAFDASSEESLMAVVNETVSEYGKLDCVLIGIDEGMDDDDVPLAKMEEMLDLNLSPAVYTLFHAIPHFHHCDSPQVVLLSTMAGEIPLPSRPVYCATRHAVHSFVKKLRQEERLKASIALGVVTDVSPLRSSAGDEEEALGRARVYARTVFSGLKEHKTTETWYIGSKSKLMSETSDSFREGTSISPKREGDE